MQHNIHSLLPNYQTLIYYHPNQLYSHQQPLQQPFFFINLNYFLAEQIPPNNAGLPICSFLPNCQEQKPEEPSGSTRNQSETALNPPTQNGLDQQLVGKGLQNRKGCVRENNDIQFLKQQDEIICKRGNDRFIKKNTQSNVINQVFSFLWTPEKSRPFLLKILQEEPKIQAFYKLMKLIKLNCKSQLNRHYMKSLTEREEFENIFAKLKKKVKKIECISLQEICGSIKKLVFLYLRQISRFSIMTSKKMNPKLWKLHFSKCEEIRTFLFVSPQI